ncbi:hypothetical protein N9H39_01900 [Gammaproteobacteria bacterium]|nr:hypothetical protein [Gammaproteobacteria bacterium]
MAAHAFDVVLVSDFSGPVANRFETMTLFFLASWMEFGGRSRDLPLHIACIGEAPESVRSLGARCKANITSHSPLHAGGFANKLRGFEVNRQTDHVLLLDSDMLVLSEINGLHAILGEDCIAAAAANGPCIVPPVMWRRIHEMLGLTYPENQVTPLNLELDTFQCAPYRERQDCPPFYNGGIVYAPWRSELGEVWHDHFVQITAVAERKAKISNQPPLATAIEYLQTRGFRFQLLPDEYHVRWQHISAGSVSSNNTRLLHTIGFGRWSAKKKENTAREDMDIYLKNTLRLTRELRSHRDPATQAEHRATSRPQIRDCYRVHELMKILYDKYVRELKE